MGYEESGTPAKAVRRKPYCVVLLDEIEKAHPERFNMLLQLFDEGRLTDASGRVIDFASAVVIMTSNSARKDISENKTLGLPRPTSRLISNGWRRRCARNSSTCSTPSSSIGSTTIVFHPLQREHIAQIVGMMLGEVRKRLADEELTIKLSDAGSEFLVSHGYDERYGARPLKRAIQRYIEDPLSERILIGDFSKGDEIDVDVSPDGARLDFRVLTPSPNA